MKKLTFSLLAVLVSVFFMGQTSLAQTMRSKTVAVAKSTAPVENIAKSTDSFNKADMYSIDFEDEDDWTFDFTPWTVIDVDGLTTMTTPTISFPHEGEPMAFIVANPTTTVPPLDSLTWPAIWPHSGIQARAEGQGPIARRLAHSG